MGRKPRVEFEGALYHVIQRGNNREYILDSDGEKGYLLKKLIDCKRRLGFRLYGYVIMGNHYHLIVQTLDEPLHKIMHYVNSAFGKYYNSINERTGHVFEGRYKGILVQDESYVLTLLRYVHQNPVRAGICNNVWEYPWSSDMFYRYNRHEFVDIELILDMLSTNREQAVARYREFVQEEEVEDCSFAAVVGGEDAGASKGLNEILLDTGVSLREYELIKSGSRKRYLVPYKKAFAQEARKHNYTLQQIARHIRLSESTISKLLQ